MSEILDFPVTVITAAATATTPYYCPNLVLVRRDETSHYDKKELKAAGIEKMWGLYLVDLDRTVPDPCFPEKFPVMYEAWTMPDAPVFKRVYKQKTSAYQKDVAMDLIFANTDDDEVRHFTRRQVAAMPARNKKKINLYDLYSHAAGEFDMAETEWFAAATNKEAHDHLMREAVNFICLCDLWELATW